MILKNLKSQIILGAIAGDIIGSLYEFNNIKSTEFNLFNSNSNFTDDTILTMAVTDCIVNNKDFSKTIWEYGRKYPNYTYGPSFINWLNTSNPKPYGSWGNGSAMRVSAIGSHFESLEEVLEMAKQSATVSHNHPEGIKGAQATASAIYLAKTGKSKKEIRDYLSNEFDYDLDFTLDSIRDSYSFKISCQESVPHAIVAFLESSDLETTIRLAISIGGDSDTIACIAGGIATAYYKEIPVEMFDFILNKLPIEFKELIYKFDTI